MKQLLLTILLLSFVEVSAQPTFENKADIYYKIVYIASDSVFGVYYKQTITKVTLSEVRRDVHFFVNLKQNANLPIIDTSQVYANIKKISKKEYRQLIPF